MRVSLLAVLFLFLFTTAIAQSLDLELRNTAMTTNPDPINYPTISYEEYQAQIPSLGTFREEVVSTKLDPERNRANFLILVRDTLYPSIQSSIQTYQNDLYNEGFSTIVVSWAGSQPISLKATISQYYSSHAIVGVMLVGNLPVAWYEYETLNDEGELSGNWDEFPCELYFADMDGTWTDADSDGKWDLHTNGTHPEIWISRIRADNLPTTGQTEVSLITSYFARNHLHRIGGSPGTNQALVYVDDDWQSGGSGFQQSMRNLYTNTTLVNTSAETNAPDYRDNRLPGTYEFIQVMAHSSPTHHNFKVVIDEVETSGNVHSYELPNVANSKFYNLFACSNARFTDSNCMGSVYLLGNQNTLNVVGTAKTGSMLAFSEFYYPLSQNLSFGQAYKEWWEQAIQDNGASYDRIHWFYGNLLLGDCSLRVRYSPNSVYWNGSYSTEWSHAQNWSNGVVPGPDSNVFIPANTVRSPVISLAPATCKDIQIAGTQTLGIYNNFYVYGDFYCWGEVNLFGSSTQLMISGDTLLGDGSVLNTNFPTATLYFEGDLTVLSGADLTVSANLYFGGANTAKFVNHCPDTYFGDLSVQKSGGSALLISEISSEDFDVRGHISVFSNAILICNSTKTIRLHGNIASSNTSFSGLRMMAGTIALTGTSHTINTQHADDRINSLSLEAGGAINWVSAPHIYGDFTAFSGTSITIGDPGLMIDGSCTIGGNLVMNSATGDLIVGGNMIWNSGSTASISNANAEIKIGGDLEFKINSNVNFGTGYLEFTGNSISNLINSSTNTVINHLKNSKVAPGYLNLSSSGNANFSVMGNIWNYQGRKLTGNSNGTISLYGNLTSYNTTTDGIMFVNGTLRLAGTNQNINIPNSQDYINNLTINSTGVVLLENALTLKGSFTQTSGIFRPLTNLLKIGGNFLVSGSGSYETAGTTVQFNGSATQTINSNFSFNVLQLNKPMDSLIIPDGVIVSTQSLKYMSGVLRLMGGTFTANDMVDNGIVGRYNVSSGTLNLNQDISQVIDLDADITMSGGTMNITGGYGLPANWAFARPINLTMSGGTLNLPPQGVTLTNTGNAINLNLTGGIIRTAGHFLIQRSGFNPSGGIIELYGTGDCNVGGFSGSKFSTLRINKASSREDGQTRANTANLTTDTIVDEDLEIVSGQLSIGACALTVNGNTTVYSGIKMISTSSVFNSNGILNLEATSSSQFTAGNLNLDYIYTIQSGATASFGSAHYLNFVGGRIQNPVCYSQTINFYNVKIDKTANFVQFSGSEANTNFFKYAGTLNLVSGNNLRLIDYTTCNGGNTVINGTLIINSNNPVSFVTLNHNGTINHQGGNLSVSSGFTRGTSSILNLSGGEFKINSPYSGTLYWLSGTTNITGGSLVFANNGMQLGTGCTFSQSAGSVKIGYNFRAGTTDVFQPAGGSFEFIGSRNGSVELASGCRFYNLVINKTSLDYTLSNSSNVLVNNDLVVQSGVFAPATTYTCTIARDVLISGGRLDAGAANQLLKVGRNWQNTAGPDAFTEGSGIVEFYSYLMSVIGSETFNKLYISKGFGFYQRAVIPDAETVVATTGVNVLYGCLGIDAGGILDSDGYLVIETDAGLSYAPDSGTATLRLGGYLENYNTTTSQTVGIYCNTNSLMILDGALDQSIVSDAPYLYAGTLQIIKPSGIANIWVPLQCKNDFIINQGTVNFPTAGGVAELWGDLILADNASLSLADDTLKFFGGANAVIDSYETIPVATVYVTKTAPAYLELTRNLVFSGSGSITINSGEMRLNSFDFTPSGNVNVSSGAKLVLGGGATLRMSPNMTLSVWNTTNPHSRLVSIGEAGNPARITCRDGYYAINIENYGTIQASYTIFEKMGTNGLNLGARTGLDPANPLDHCTFRQGISGGRLITSISTAVMNIPDAVFENTHPTTSIYNVYKTSGAAMTFVNATGNFSGEANDYDPNNLVTWETLGPPPVPQNIAVQIVGSSIQVTWSASTGASSYQIYRSLDPLTGWSLIGSTGSLSWIDIAPPEQRAFYRVTAE